MLLLTACQSTLELTYFNVILLHSIIILSILLQPLSKRDKFFLGNPTSEEYAKKFTKMGLKETMGINFDGWSFDNVGGVNLNRVFKGIRKALGMGPSSSSAAKSSEL